MNRNTPGANRERGSKPGCVQAAARMASGSSRTRSGVAALLVFTAVRMGSSFILELASNPFESSPEPSGSHCESRASLPRPSTRDRSRCTGAASTRARQRPLSSGARAGNERRDISRRGWLSSNQATTPPRLPSRLPDMVTLVQGWAMLRVAVVPPGRMRYSPRVGILPWHHGPLFGENHSTAGSWNGSIGANNRWTTRGRQFLAGTKRIHKL